MNIGIDARAARWYRGTGIGTYTYQLIRNINIVDQLNRYLLFFPDNKVEDLLPGNNVDFSLINGKDSDNFWRKIYIPNCLGSHNIDVYMVPQNGIGLPEKKPCPFVITLHDVIPFRMPETVSPEYLSIFRNEVPDIINTTDAIITVSNFSKQDIHEVLGYPLEKIYVSHLSAEDSYHPFDRMKCRHYIKKNYNIDGNFILYVGGFSPRKNISNLIMAFSHILKAVNNSFKLVITGKKGASFDKYRSLSDKLGISDNVIFTGFIPFSDLPIFYNAASVFCYPSYYEGFGLPPLEAMACGTPVVASSLTSIPEVLGNSALYSDPNNERDMAEKILNLVYTPSLWQKYSRLGLIKSREYSWRKTAAETINILEKTAGNKRS